MDSPGPLIEEPVPVGAEAPGSYSRQIARMALHARLMVSDAVALLIGFSIARQIRGEEWLAPYGVSLMLIVLPLYLAVAAYGGAYSLHTLTTFFDSARRSILALVQTFLIVITALFLAQVSEEISRVALLSAFAAVVFPMLVFRLITCNWVKSALEGRIFDDLVIVDGLQIETLPTAFVIDASANNLSPDLNDPTMLSRFARVTAFYDRIIIACSADKQNAWSILLKTINSKGELLIDRDDTIGAIGIDSYGGHETIVVSRGGMNRVDAFKKRVFDLAVAIPTLIVLAPLLLVVAILIKLDSPGPVFFRQPRVGQHTAVFQIFKFRSMRHEASDVGGSVSTRRDDARVSRLGKFIRRTSIDELPQLFNVLRGEMSIVGPRPHALGSTAEDLLFWEISQRYWERHVLKPGITGLAQVRGFRGATEKSADLLNRLQADLDYVNGWRLWRDIEIIFATLEVVVHPNAY